MANEETVRVMMKSAGYEDVTFQRVDAEVLVGKDTEDGRLTIMGAGGSIEANIDRWYGQFKQPDGSSTKDKAKVSKSKVAGQTVHMVDISGTFKTQMPLANHCRVIAGAPQHVGDRIDTVWNYWLLSPS